jgi:hypothetical protein
MRPKLLLLMAMLALFAACQRNGNRNRIFCLLPSNTATAVSADCDVLRSGVRIGKLTEIGVYPRRPSTASGYLELEDGVCLADSSSFMFCSTGLIAPKPFIMVTSAGAARCLTPRDTILVSTCAIFREPFTDSITVKLVDSLLRHLKRTYAKPIGN